LPYLLGYFFVPEVRETDEFCRWLRRVRDPTLKARIVRRIERLAAGNAGDRRHLGARLYELREHAGPGYRVYYTVMGERLIVLLAGGDKRSQERDIDRARFMIERLRQQQ
jgi:putative addiction module killer protein